MPITHPQACSEELPDPPGLWRCHADPRVAADMARSFVTGLQGGDGTATYIKAAATCKHFVGNDMENWHGAARATGADGLLSMPAVGMWQAAPVCRT